MTDRLRAVEIELAHLQSKVAQMERDQAMFQFRWLDRNAYTSGRQAYRGEEEKPLDPSIPIWQR